MQHLKDVRELALAKGFLILLKLTENNSLVQLISNTQVQVDFFNSMEDRV